jgi:hypothetical protein
MLAVPHISTRKAKLLGLGAAILGALLWGCFIELYIYFDYTRPHVVDAAAGRLYALNNHGSIAYLTGNEHHFLYALEWTAWGLFLVAAVLHQYCRRRAKVEESGS